MEYFFTCGRGTETYVTKELNEKFPGSKVQELITCTRCGLILS